MSKGSSATSAKSVQDARKRLEQFLKKLGTVPSEELEKSATKIYAEAVSLTPYKTGKLERSVYVRVSKDKRRPGLVAGATATSKRGYNYAGIQHENESFNHPIKGQAHFISEPFKHEINNLKKRIRRRLKVTK